MTTSSRRNSPHDAARLGRWAFGIAVFSLLLRVVFVDRIELLPEEAYYWNYSRHIDIGYLDHPPMVAWLIRVGTSLAGNTAWGVRLGSIFCGLIASFFCYKTALNLFDKKNALLALVLVQTLPFFFMAGFLMTPDSPLTAAWAAFLYYFERVIAGRTRAWLGVGCALGVGLLSKYTMGLAAFAAFAYLLAEARLRFWMRRREPYLAMVLAVAIFSPVLLWNFQHDWVSFAFQTVRRIAERPRFSLPNLIGSALALIGPVGVATTMAVSGGKAARDRFLGDEPGMARRRKLLLWLCGFPLLVFAGFSVRHQIRVDWLGAPSVAAVPMMSYGMLAWKKEAGRLRRFLAAAWPATIAVFLVLYVAGFTYLAVGLPGVGYSAHMELLPVGWKDLARQVGETARTLNASPADNLIVVGMDRYETASELAFYSADTSQVIGTISAGHLVGGIGLMYEQWFPKEVTKASYLLLVSWNRTDLADDRLKDYVEQLAPLRTGAIKVNGGVVRPYFYRCARGFPKASRRLSAL